MRADTRRSHQLPAAPLVIIQTGAVQRTLRRLRHLAPRAFHASSLSPAARNCTSSPTTGTPLAGRVHIAMTLLAIMRQLRPLLCQRDLLQPVLQQQISAASAQQLISLQPAAWRGIATSPAARGLEEFFDTPGKDGQPPPAGTPDSRRQSADALPGRVGVLATWSVLSVMDPVVSLVQWGGREEQERSVACRASVGGEGPARQELGRPAQAVVGYRYWVASGQNPTLQIMQRLIDGSALVGPSIYILAATRSRIALSLAGTFC